MRAHDKMSDNAPLFALIILGSGLLALVSAVVVVAHMAAKLLL